MLDPDEEGRSEFALEASDPRRLGDLELVARMRDSADPLVPGGKPFPFRARVPTAERGGGRADLVVKVTRLPSSELASRCLDEEESWARTTGRLYAIGEDADHRWVARQYIAGLALNRVPDSTPARRKTVWALWLAKELDGWHSQRHTCHLDVKPSNVVITPVNAILIDFETSRARASGDAFNGLGTARFASPEQLVARPGREVGAASDVFSWGLTVLDMFAPDAHPYCGGPFDHGTMARIDAAVARGEDAPAPAVEAIESLVLREAVAAALAWDPAARPSAAELVSLLTVPEPRMVVNRTTVTSASPVAAGPRPDPLASARRWFSPEGPLGARTVDFYVHLTALAVAVAVGLVAGTLLAFLVGKVFGA